ncbi:MAG TPA: hypothetical protein VI408_00445 [Gaiellaceae bacterium]
MIRALVIAVTLLAGATTPHEAVLRFIENRTPKDACAQLAPAYQASLAKQYGPCLAGMRHQPKATHISVSRERITGTRATVYASYDVPGGHFRERYTLTRTHGVWLITGARPIP